MQIIGFNFTKLAAEHPGKLSTPYDINTNIEFLDVIPQPTELLKDSQALRVDFKFIISYSSHSSDKKTSEPLAKVEINGNSIVAAQKDETDEFQKNWKKKNHTDLAKINLFNFIIRRCTPKALELEEDVGLPLHIPLPKVAAKQ